MARHKGVIGTTFFGCAVEHIFKPSTAWQPHMQEFLNAMKPAENLLIGINVRVSDSIFFTNSADKTSIEILDQLTSCADALFAEFKRKVGEHSQNLSLYLMTNSPALRKIAPERGIYVPIWPAQHIDNINVSFAETWPAFAETLIFSKMDLRIIYHNQRGFAKLAGDIAYHREMSSKTIFYNAGTNCSNPQFVDIGSIQAKRETHPL